MPCGKCLWCKETVFARLRTAKNMGDVHFSPLILSRALKAMSAKTKNVSDSPAQCRKQVACNAKMQKVRIAWHYAHSRQKSIMIESAALICGMVSVK